MILTFWSTKEKGKCHSIHYWLFLLTKRTILHSQLLLQLIIWRVMSSKRIPTTFLLPMTTHHVISCAKSCTFICAATPIQNENYLYYKAMILTFWSKKEKRKYHNIHYWLFLLTDDNTTFSTSVIVTSSKLWVVNKKLWTFLWSNSYHFSSTG